jgi:hypothetical protein
MPWELLDRYLLRQCSPAEQAEVERWLAESPVRRELLEQLASFDESHSGASSAQKAAVWAQLERELSAGLKQSDHDR